MKDHPRSGKAQKLSDKQAIHLITVACSGAPDDHNHRTLRLLADKVVELIMPIPAVTKPFANF